MNKKLSTMTLEELWQLFPIFLTERNPNWASWYIGEVALLKSLLPYNADYHHVGSTAIEGIMAKPIVDILVVVESIDVLKQTASILQKSGYIIMSEKQNRISLNKGYTEMGFAEKVFHIHLRLKGDEDEILFRDYLNAHKDVAKEYEELKLNLWKKYEHDRDAYTEGKTQFVTKYTNIAKQGK